MNKKLAFLFLIFIPIVILSACDSRRNQIIANILVSPTMTETPVPPTLTPTIAPTLTPTLSPTPYIAAENMDLLIVGDYDLANHNITKRVNDTKNPVDKLKAQTDMIELSYLKEDYSTCMKLMDNILETLETTQERPSEVLAKANYIHAQCADHVGENSVVIAERYYEDIISEEKFATNNATYFFRYKDLLYLSNLKKSEMMKERKNVVFTAYHVLGNEKKIGRWGSSVVFAIAKTMQILSYQ